MPTLVDALDRVVTLLRSAGVDATTDPRDLVLPGAWVTVHDVAEVVLCGEPVIRADVCLIVGDFGTPVYLAQLGELLDAALTVLTLDEPAQPATVTPPGHGPMPALVITTATE